MIKRIFVIFVALCAVLFSPISQHAWACTTVPTTYMCFGEDLPRIFKNRASMHRPAPGSKVVMYQIQRPNKPLSEIRSIAEYYSPRVLTMPNIPTPSGDFTRDIYGKVAGGIIPILNYTTTLIAGHPCPGVEVPTYYREIRDPYTGMPAWEHENLCYVQQALDAAVAAVRFNWNIQPINEALALARREAGLAKRLNVGVLNNEYLKNNKLDDYEFSYPFSKNPRYPLYMIVSAHRGMNWLTPFDESLYYQFLTPDVYPPVDAAVFMFYVVSASLDDACMMTMYGVMCNSFSPEIHSFPVHVRFNRQAARWEVTQYYSSVPFMVSQTHTPALYGFNDKVQALSVYYPPFRLWLYEMMKARQEGRPVNPYRPLFGVKSALEFIPETLYAPAFSGVLSSVIPYDKSLMDMLKADSTDPRWFIGWYEVSIIRRPQSDFLWEDYPTVAEVGAQVREQLDYSPQYRVEQTRTMGSRYMFTEQVIGGNGGEARLYWANDYRTRTLYQLEVKNGRVEACRFYQRDAWMVQPQSLSYVNDVVYRKIESAPGGQLKYEEYKRPGHYFSYFLNRDEWRIERDDPYPKSDYGVKFVDSSGRQVRGEFEIPLPGNSTPWEFSGFVKYRSNHAFNVPSPLSADEVEAKCAQAERDGAGSALALTQFVMGWAPENARLMHYKDHRVVWFVPSPYDELIGELKQAGVEVVEHPSKAGHVVWEVYPYYVHISPWQLLDARSGDAIKGAMIELKPALNHTTAFTGVTPLR